MGHVTDLEVDDRVKVSSDRRCRTIFRLATGRRWSKDIEWVINYIRPDMEAVDRYMRQLLISAAKGYIQVSDYELALRFAGLLGWERPEYRKVKRAPELIEVYHSTPQYHKIPQNIEVGKLYPYEGSHGVGYKRYEDCGGNGKTIIRIYVPRGEDEEGIII